MDEVSTEILAKVTNTPIPTVDRWVREGLLGVEIAMPGRGNARRYNEEDVAAFLAVHYVLQMGADWEKARRIAIRFRQLFQSETKTGNLIVYKKGAHFVITEEENEVSVEITGDETISVCIPIRAIIVRAKRIIESA